MHLMASTGSHEMQITSYSGIHHLHSQEHHQRWCISWSQPESQRLTRTRCLGGDLQGLILLIKTCQFGWHKSSSAVAGATYTSQTWPFFRSRFSTLSLGIRYYGKHKFVYWILSLFSFGNLGIKIVYTTSLPHIHYVKIICATLESYV
jgi:hypothetical protein